MGYRFPQERIDEARRGLARAHVEAVQIMADGATHQAGAEAFVVRRSVAVDALIAQFFAAAKAQIGGPGREAALRAVSQVVPVALGGYGRNELCPFSDVDLLFLIPETDEGVVAPFVETILYGLWDVGLELGHAIRTRAECLEVAREDQTALTSLIDARVIPCRESAHYGQHLACLNEVQSSVDASLLSGAAAQDFIAVKRDEAAGRRNRFGDSIYRLEPDVKSGQGGLRELHTALWISRARWQVSTLPELVRLGIISPEGRKSLARAYGFMLRVRTELHLLAGRRRETLGFSHQEAIAQTLGYAGQDPSAQRHGTERFMRAYYFHARQCLRLSDLIVERASNNPPTGAIKAEDGPMGFKVLSGKLTASDRAQFQRDPSAIMRIFRVAQEHDYEIYGHAQELVGRSLQALDRAARRDPVVVSDFLAILCSPGTSGRTIEMMRDLGVLARFIPEFRRVTSRWQHSLYHVYTVDVHSVMTVRKLKGLRSGQISTRHKEVERHFGALTRPAVLFMAGLLHDIGKGWRGADHSARGERVARVVGGRLEVANVPEWGASETQDLAWLVREHLLMSDISQRRDLNDPEMVAGFAKNVATTQRLSMLWLLTIADMMATSPKVWNSWKESLLFELFEKTVVVLDSDPESQHGSESKRRTHFLSAMQSVTDDAASAAALESFVGAAPARYVLAMDAEQAMPHVGAWQAARDSDALTVAVQHRRRDQVTRISVVCRDRPGLLAWLSGVVAAARLQILAAQIFSFDDGQTRVAIDDLYVTNQKGDLMDDAGRWDEIQDQIRQAIRGALDVDALLARRSATSLLAPRHRPAVETRVEFPEDDSASETVIDVYCQDHLGALYAIAKTLAGSGLNISLAKISTQGDRVVDGFYVVDARTGAKLEDRQRIADLKAQLRDAIENIA